MDGSLKGWQKGQAASYEMPARALPDGGDVRAELVKTLVSVRWDSFNMLNK
jgi:hypothetical protein